MTYQPYLVANYATGLDNRLQPWLTADDAQQELFDGYVYRGTLSKRDGYKYFATGETGGQPYTESRIVHQITGATPASGLINGINKVYTFNFTGPVRRGSVTITGSNPVQVITDNGLGGFTGAVDPMGTNTINYTTGSVTVTFLVAPAVASTVTAIYSYMPDDPVMMIASFYTATNIRQSIVASTRYINRYNSTLNIYEDISGASTPYTGTKFNFFSWVNYRDANDDNRLIFTNNVDPVQEYDGSTVTDYVYTSSDFSTLTALLVFDFKDRLVLLRTTEDAVVYPRRIRISGTGADSDNFDLTATGAGVIDIPDDTWIMGAAFNRDDLLIFTEAATWTLKYTGNDTTPFVLDKIDESRGSQAPYAAITYLNRTSAVSPRGLIITDGYKVERQDEMIPDFSFNQIDPENFQLCFAGSVDADRDHYLIYPSTSQSTSNRILTTNYDEDNYAVYRLPLSCMGNFLFARNITWADLDIYENWYQFASAYGSWKAFSFTRGTPISLGGGHHGEIWLLNVTEEEDNPVKIRNITIVDSSTIQVTTDWNNFSEHEFDDASLPSDTIFLTGVEGMLEVNNQQFAITSVTNHYTFNLKVPFNTNILSAYTGGGEASRVIPFSALFKKFNPYIAQDKKVRCGWLYMYVDSTDTKLKRNIQIVDATQDDPCVITTAVDHGLQTGNQITIFGVGGMTELNDGVYFVTVLTSTTFLLDGVDATGFTAYTSGGYAAAAVPAKMSIDIITNDTPEPTQLSNPAQNPYQGNCTNLVFEDGVKKWYKVFINQIGKFIQFRLRNSQAGATINVQATMPGFQPVGRII